MPEDGGFRHELYVVRPHSAASVLKPALPTGVRSRSTGDYHAWARNAWGIRGDSLHYVRTERRNPPRLSPGRGRLQTPPATLPRAISKFGAFLGSSDFDAKFLGQALTDFFRQLVMHTARAFFGGIEYRNRRGCGDCDTQPDQGRKRESG